MVKPTTKAEQDSLQGLLFAGSAFLIWGIAPIYWKTLSAVPAFEILLHRVVWSFLFLLPLVVRKNSRSEFFYVLRNGRLLLVLLSTTLFVSTNWLIFIWSVNTGHVLQASLGYYINPLLNVVMGMIFLKERLRRAQAIAVILAGLGVLILTVSQGQFPWVAFSLAFSFGCYGLIRKVVPVSALVGLTMETLILLLPSTGWLAHLYITGRGAFLHMGLSTDLLLAASALSTAFPLLLFTLGARRLHLSTLGFMQYLVPSCFFLFAVFLFKEPVSRIQIMTFVFIWSALAIYTTDSMLVHRRAVQLASRPAA